MQNAETHTGKAVMNNRHKMYPFPSMLSFPRKSALGGVEGGKGKEFRGEVGDGEGVGLKEIASPAIS